MYPVAENRQAVAGSAHPWESFLSKLFRFSWLDIFFLTVCLISLLHINLHNVFLLSISVSPPPPLPLCGHRIHVYLFPTGHSNSSLT